MTPALYYACERAVHVVKADGTVLRAGRASVFVMDQIGWHTAARILVLPPFLWGVELSYRIVAANRPFFACFFLRH
jgi:hypothetical protein